MKILVRMTNWVGDCLIATPALRFLRKKYPDAEIDVCVKKALFPLFENNTNINHLIEVPSGNKFKSFFLLTKRIKQNHYDAVYILPRSWNSALAPFWAGIPARIGYANQGRGVLLTQSRKRKKQLLSLHQSAYYWHLVAGNAEMPEEEVAADFLIDPAIQQWGKEKLKELFGHKKVIGIAPGATFGSAKMWLPNRFLRLSELLLKDSQIGLLFFGGPAEAAWINPMIESLDGAYSVAGKTSLQELGALMQYADLVLTNDSGPMHVAAAIKAPLLVLFGPTNYENTSPMGRHALIHKRVACSPCLLRHCPIDHRCMKQISVDEVYAKILGILEEKNKLEPELEL